MIVYHILICCIVLAHHLIKMDVKTPTQAQTVKTCKKCHKSDQLSFDNITYRLTGFCIDCNLMIYLNETLRISDCLLSIMDRYDVLSSGTKDIDELGINLIQLYDKLQNAICLIEFIIPKDEAGIINEILKKSQDCGNVLKQISSTTNIKQFGDLMENLVKNTKKCKKSMIADFKKLMKINDSYVHRISIIIIIITYIFETVDKVDKITMEKRFYTY